MEREVDTLLRKEAIEVVPPHKRESGFYSQYFIVPGGCYTLVVDEEIPPDNAKCFECLEKTLYKCNTLLLISSKEEWRVASRFRSVSVEPLSQQTEVQDAHTQTGSVSDQVRGLFFFKIDLKDAYFHVSILPTHRKFLRFAFGGEAYQYRVLPFSLAHSPRTFTKCVDTALAPRYLHTQLHQRLVDSRSIRADDGSTSRCCSRSYESVGVKTKRQEECAFSWVPTTCQKCYIYIYIYIYIYTHLILPGHFIRYTC